MLRNYLVLDMKSRRVWSYCVLSGRVLSGRVLSVLSGRVLSVWSGLSGLSCLVWSCLLVWSVGLSVGGLV